MSQIVKTPFTRLQPADGDVVLVCAHNGKQVWHWYSMEDGSTVEKINLQTGEKEIIEAKWICICEECFGKYDSPEEAVAGDRIWCGDDPFIRENRPS